MISVEPLLPVTRRVFLGAAGVTVLAACGAGNTSSSPVTGDGDDFALVRYFGEPSVTAGSDRRLALGLADVDGTRRPDGPAELQAALLDEQGELIAETVGRRRADSVALPYYEFRVNVPSAAIYTLRVDVNDARAEASFTVVEPGALPFPGSGDQLPPFDTPTVDDPGGIDPICTREPNCPFHDVTLTDALAAGRPVVYLIGTPAFCQTGTCGPILELLVEVASDFDGVTFVHSEVFTDNSATTTAPAVDASGLTFEPAIFLVGSDGVVSERLDVVVDVSELRDRIERIAQ